MTGTFPRTRRILKTDDFSSVFRLRPIQKTVHLALYAVPNGLPFARLGVVAPKRLAPCAVTRNTVKRAVREGFRLSPDLQVAGLDCVVRLIKPLAGRNTPATSAQIKAVLFEEVKALFSDPKKLQRSIPAKRVDRDGV